MSEKEEFTGEQCGTVNIDLFNNVVKEDSCYNCVTFPGPYLYCKIFDHTVRSGVSFDEFGGDNRCELFTKISPI